MNPSRVLRSIARRVGKPILHAIRTLQTAGEGPAVRVATTGFFRADDIDWVCDTYFTQGMAAGTMWHRVMRDAHMTLPDWFQPGLDPWSEAYAEQQHRLWQLVAGVDRPYEPDVDEKEYDWGNIDPVRSPGFYVRRDPQAVSAASDHVLATGMFLKHCGLAPGDWALEYGAGFGQTALALARLGVNVDTVDISTTFCEFVRRQAEFFQVPLTAFQGHFGFNPRGAQQYRLIWFYESFHHCLDFKRVVHELRQHLAPGGRIILGGEPIFEREYAAVPYPWGVRLHSEVAAVMRRTRWFELGFSEDFLFELFTKAGFVGHRIDCEPSLFGRLFVFEHRPAEVALARQWLPPVIREQWHAPERDGRWTRATSTLPLDTTDSFRALEIDLANPLRRRQHVVVKYGLEKQVVDIAPGSIHTLRFDAKSKAGRLVIQCQLSLPGWIDRIRTGDSRALGVFVKRLRYVA